MNFLLPDMFVPLWRQTRELTAKHSELFQISPIYYGMLMKCSGNDRRIYLMAGLEVFLKIENDNDHIFRTMDYSFYKFSSF